MASKFIKELNDYPIPHCPAQQKTDDIALSLQKIARETHDRLSKAMKKAGIPDDVRFQRLEEVFDTIEAPIPFEDNFIASSLQKMSEEVNNYLLNAMEEAGVPNNEKKERLRNVSASIVMPIIDLFILTNAAPNNYVTKATPVTSSLQKISEEVHNHLSEAMTKAGLSNKDIDIRLKGVFDDINEPLPSANTTPNANAEFNAASEIKRITGSLQEISRKVHKHLSEAMTKAGVPSDEMDARLKRASLAMLTPEPASLEHTLSKDGYAEATPVTEALREIAFKMREYSSDAMKKAGVPGDEGYMRSVHVFNVINTPLPSVDAAPPVSRFMSVTVPLQKITKKMQGYLGMS